jgi:hypothetical protein
MSNGALAVGPQTLGAAQDALVAPSDGAEAIVYTIAAGLTGTIVFEASLDGTTYFGVPAWGTTGGSSLAGSFANPAAQMFYVAAGPAHKFVRCRISAYTSGSCVAAANVDDADVPAYVSTIVLNTPSVNLAQYAATSSQTAPFNIYRYKSTASDNLANVKASATNVHHIIVGNANAALRFLKLYNKATAPVLASDTPVATIVIPANGQIVVPYDLIRLPFSLGLGHAIVTAAADATSGNTGADEVFLTMLYA